MLTYTLDKQAGLSLYEQLYRRVKADILSGRLAAGEKLPSKRALAAHLEVSVITVKNAYEQLMAEGYLTGVEKKGYFVSAVLPSPAAVPASPEQPPPPREPVWFLDLATNSIAAEDFPFTVWARLMRQTILEQGTGLLRSTPPQGAWALRQAIAAHLRQFRAMEVTAEQIIVGAGTEVLYNLLVQLLGRDRLYGVEDPGYGKIAHIYRAAGAEVTALPLDEAGVSVEALRRSDADVVHISPSHHYPTGLVMPIARRQELLRWAQEVPARVILEDDYDSEFRFVGRPIPTLFSIDGGEQVVYLNTFSKTIAPSIRISFMVLPRRLLADFRQKLGFYACTVSAFEQYTLAQFLAGGWYEKHLSRMRKHYRQKRDAVIAAVYKARWPPMPPSPRRMRACISCCGWTARRRTRHSAVRRSSAVSVWPCCPITTSVPRTHPSTCWWSTIPASTWTGFPPPWSVLPPYGRRMTMYDELTRADLQKMQEEIDYRVQQLRPKLIEDVQTARAFGDLSENFEYKCAKQEKNRNDARIRYLQRMIKTAKVIEDKSAADTAGLYDTVEIFMENLGKSRKIQLVTTLRQDALKGWISKESPVGRAVMGRKAGDRVYVDMGSGKGYYLQIRAIEKGTDNGDIPIGSF